MSANGIQEGGVGRVDSVDVTDSWETGNCVFFLGMMFSPGMPCSKIQKILNVSATFISQCKMKFIENGVEELKLKYQGSKAYLSQAQRREIINYLDSQVYLSLQEFR
ncbi:hypothetical protein QT971_30090 [Microcoleus sp. herbarium19]|uniref:hypothetical protein n=1 Tax=unclassified Microcoleus TaxID=2642155 RepID=UPI002FD3F05B